MDSVGYERLLDQAVAAFDAKDYARARDLFERAYALRPNARVMRGLGISSLRLLRFSAAKRELAAALTDTRQPLTRAQREQVTRLLSWIDTHLGTVRLQLRPPSAQVALDGDRIDERELVMKPGAHRVRVSAEGYLAQERSLRVEVGQDQALSIELVSQAPQPARVATAAGQTADNGSAQPNRLRLSPTKPAHPPARDSSSPLLSRWWFWTAVGVVVAGGVATTLALTTPAASSYEQGVGGVIRIR